jgi:hypothetical protein
VRNYVVEIGTAGKIAGKIGGVTAVVGLPGALIDKAENPSMSTIEFLYRAFGLYDLAVEVGNLPPPPPEM